MDRENVDTDAIIPSSSSIDPQDWFWCINLFDAWRYSDAGFLGKTPPVSSQP
jgi:3-isopropylmalate dehydratase small subunit